MQRRNNKKPVHNASASRIVVGVEDMVLLQDVRDTGIVSNLNTRLQAQQIYTYIGHVLVVCNPFTWLPIYDPTYIKQYVHQSRLDVPPHIFATAEAAYRSLVLENDNQAIIISGESGAGKTEASKHIQTYIASICGGGEHVERVKSVFLASNPVLEAFGNAKTLRNNNSSRFGKYFELKFDRFGSPQGGLITNYLLEKSRIVRPNEQERNFHIFYQLLNSPYANSLKLTSSSSNYEYLSCSKCDSIDGVNDAHEFESTLNGMRAVGLKNGQIQSMLTLVAAVLHLGNVRFQGIEVDGADGSKISSKDAIRQFCELLKIEDVAALEKALVYRTLVTMAPGGKIDTYEVPQIPVQAAARRDGIAKALYERLFNLIVSRINAALAPIETDPESSANEELLNIGVLDIYGFEVFQKNGFEQLCINYVNEKLQQIFIELTLRAEQEEYEREGIAWEPIPFFNNRIVCELLDGARPPGVFRILDDTCKSLHGTKDSIEVDRKFVETCSQLHGRHAHFLQNAQTFTIKHYAGDVSYSIGKLSESNRDSLNKDLLAVLKTSNDKLVQHLFPEEVDWSEKRGSTTLGGLIRTQCQSLVDSLMECSPHYVRCIKSNDSRKSLHIDNNRVVHQVKYLGLAENIKVRRAGFAYRSEYHRFFDRFNIVSPSTHLNWKGSDKDGCRQILKIFLQFNANIAKEEFQFGKTKVFVRRPETFFALEKFRERVVGDFVAKIQRAWRKYVSRRVFIVYQRSMGKLYAQEKKIRRKDSLYRPFAGDYLEDNDATERLKEDIFRIIDYYNSAESILFVDKACYRTVIRTPNISYDSEMERAALGTLEDTKCAAEKTLLVVTTAAVYLMEVLSDRKWAEIVKSQGLQPDKAKPCEVILKRRVLLGNADPNTNKRSPPCAAIDGISLSRLGDAFFTLSVSSQLLLSAPNKSHWLADESVSECPVTKQGFWLFVRRHHCRLCGGIFADPACNYRQMLPDLGWYSEDRVCDMCVGLSAADANEDLLLYCNKRTEIVALIMSEYKKLHNGSNLSVNFSNSVTLKPSHNQLLSRNVGRDVSFRLSVGSPSASKSSKKNTSRSSSMSSPMSFYFNDMEYPLMSVESVNGSDTVVVHAPAGLSPEVVEERRARQVQRQKKMEAKRRAQEEERRQRAAVREKEREAERLRRLEEKKFKKQMEKDARKEKQEAEDKERTAKLNKVSARNVSLQESSSNKSAPKSNVSSELAAIMAKRRQQAN